MSSLLSRRWALVMGSALAGLSLLTLSTAVDAAPGEEDPPLAFDLVELNEPGNPKHPGIDFERHPVSLFAAEGGGMATVDFNNDGWIDILFSDTEGHPNHLYVNQGDGTFTEEAEARGILELAERRGSELFFDMENDGDLDLLSCGYPSQSIPNFDLYTLFRNNGEPAWDFTDVTTSAGNFELAFLPEPTLIGEAGGITCGDIDGDQYLDVFVTYWNRSGFFYFDQPRMWHNGPNPVEVLPGQEDYSERTFTDITEESGLSIPIDGWTWTPTLLDWDRDGDLDLRINIDFSYDILRMNDGTGVFGPDICTEVGMNGTPPDTRGEMGVAIADINFDTLPDTYHTNGFMDDRLYVNRSNLAAGAAQLAFWDVAPETETDVCNFGWGTAFADLDLDADLDLVAVSGMAVPYANWFHENRWPETEPGLPDVPNFVNRSAEVPNWHEPGGAPDVARNLSPFDYDHDGDLDLVIGRYGDSAFVTPGEKRGAGFFENTLESDNHWLEVDLLGENDSRNTIGARLYVRAGGVIQMRTMIGAGTSFLTQEPYRKHFGLGDEDVVTWICVRWFDGTHDVGKNFKADRILTFRRKSLDRTGDMNGDGVVNQVDVPLLQLAIRRPGIFDQVYGWWPWQVLGDIDGNGLLEPADVVLLQAMVP